MAMEFVEIGSLMKDICEAIYSEYHQFTAFAGELQVLRARVEFCGVQIGSWETILRARVDVGRHQMGSWETIFSKSLEDDYRGTQVWGVRGWGVIKELRKDMAATCARLKQLLEPFDKKEKEQEQLESLANDRPEQKKTTKFEKLRDSVKNALSARQLNIHQDQTKAVNKSASWLQKIEFIHGKKGDIASETQLLEELVKSFLTLSKMYSEEDEKRLKVNRAVVERHHRKLRRMAFSSDRRGDSEILYSTLQSAAPDMVLFVRHVQLGEYLPTYRLFCQPNGQDCQNLVVTKASKQRTTSTAGFLYSSFNEARKAALDGHVDFCLKDLKRPHTLSVSRQCAIQPLNLLATVLDRTPATSEPSSGEENFPLEKRQRFLSLLAEYALWFLGTSWLSNISSTTLAITRDGEHAPGYFLRVFDVETTRNQALVDLEKFDENGLGDVQTTRLAILMVEVRSGLRVTRAVRREAGIMLVLKDGTEWDVNGDKMREEWGPRFGKAVAHCFRMDTRGTNGVSLAPNEYQNVLEEFFEFVFLPLQEEYNEDEEVY